MNFAAAAGAAATGMAVGTSLIALLAYQQFGHVEPMVTVRPSGRMMNVELSGVAAPVKTTSIKHEGLECLEKNKFHIVSKAGFRVLPARGIFPGKSTIDDPAFTFVSDSMDYSDVTYVKFADACLKCNAASHVKYKDFFGFEKEKRLPWF